MSFAPRLIQHGRARRALRKTSVFVQINSSFGHGVDLLLRAKRFSRPWPSNHASQSLFIHHRPTAYFLKTRLVPADEKLDRKPYLCLMPELKDPDIFRTILE